MIKLDFLLWVIKSKILSFTIIDKKKKDLNNEISMFHTKRIVRNILHQIIENVIQELI